MASDLSGAQSEAIHSPSTPVLLREELPDAAPDVVPYLAHTIHGLPLRVG